MFINDSSAPRIDESTAIQSDSLTIIAGTPTVWKRIITTSTYRRTWLTKAAADSLAATLQAADSSGNTVATVERTHDIGAFQVKVTQITRGAWAQDT